MFTCLYVKNCDLIYVPYYRAYRRQCIGAGAFIWIKAPWHLYKAPFSIFVNCLYVGNSEIIKIIHYLSAINYLEHKSRIIGYTFEHIKNGALTVIETILQVKNMLLEIQEASDDKCLRRGRIK